jgi:NADP-dependent 3-hydroxy acid dehydrogenase YdfG
VAVVAPRADRFDRLARAIGGLAVQADVTDREQAVGAVERQEVTKRHVRISVVEPGAVETELFGHQRPEIQEYYDDVFAGVEKLYATYIAEAIEYIVTRPRRVAVNEVLVRPTEQA